MQLIVVKVKSEKLSSLFIRTVERRRELTQESVGASGLKVRTMGLYQFCLLESITGMRKAILFKLFFSFSISSCQVA